MVANLRSLEDLVLKELSASATRDAIDVEIDGTAATIKLDTSDSSPYVAFKFSFAKTQPDLSSILSLFGLGKIGDFIPAFLRQDDDVRIEYLEFTLVKGPTKCLKTGSFGISLPSVDLSHGFSFSDTSVHFNITDPLRDSRLVNVYLISQLSLNKDIGFGVTASLPEGVFVGALSSQQRVDVATIVNRLSGGTLKTPSYLSAVTFTQLQVIADLKQQNLVFNGALSANWELSLGIKPLAVQISRLSMLYSGTASALSIHVGASINIGDTEFDTTWSTPGAFKLEGTIPSIPLTKLVHELCGDVLPLPQGFPQITFTDADVAITKQDADYSLALAGTVDKLGQVDLEVLKQSLTHPSPAVYRYCHGAKGRAIFASLA